jgi:hypothetical protein
MPSVQSTSQAKCQIATECRGCGTRRNTKNQLSLVQENQGRLQSVCYNQQQSVHDIKY